MDNPKIHQLKNLKNSSEALIFVHGAWSEEWINSKNNKRNLVNSLENAGWKGSIYYLWWDSSAKVSDFDIINWPKIQDRASRVGEYYISELIESTIPEKNISLVGYSLGTRVICYFIKAYLGNQFFVDDVVLIAGTVHRGSYVKWGEIASKLNGNLFNIYNSNDSTLDPFIKYLHLGNSPCGLKAIKFQRKNIININVSSFVGPEHNLTHYLDFLPKIWLGNVKDTHLSRKCYKIKKKIEL